MKKIMPVFLILAFAPGCTSLPKLARELKNDPATVEVDLIVPWGSLHMKRAWPEGGTNRVAGVAPSSR